MRRQSEQNKGPAPRGTKRGGQTMARKYFGTDGIRGSANTYPMTSEVAMRVGMAAGKLFTKGSYRHRVVIGKDTRLSGYMIELALVSGFTAVGMDVFQLGPMPTPAVAMLTRSLRADLGVMISASHNPFIDNGIKLFGPDGYKLSDEKEEEIEQLMGGDSAELLAAPEMIGRATRIDSARERYIEFAKRTLPKNIRFDGIRAVIDCANGAGYKVAPEALWELGAEVIKVGVDPNGLNINKDCGSTAPEDLIRKVSEVRADIGIALDGDADRVVIVDEKGNIIDGDQLMAVIAESWQKRGRLAGGGIVATVMSNLGLERYLESIELGLGAHAGRRPLRGRAHAPTWLQCRRRAVGPYRAVGLLDHRGRPGHGAAAAVGGGPERQAGERDLQSVRAVAANPEECPLQERPAARQCRRAAGDQRRQVEARQIRAAGDPAIGHRAGDSSDGRGRRREARQDRGLGNRPRPDRRGRLEPSERFRRTIPLSGVLPRRWRRLWPGCNSCAALQLLLVIR